MAKNSESKTYDAKATQYIKYGGEHLEPGDCFKVKEEDLEQLKNFAEIEFPKEESSDGENGGQ